MPTPTLLLPFITFILVIVLPVSAQADMSPAAVLDKIYGKQNKQQGCWLAADGEGQRYCMKIDGSVKRATVTGKRLYLLAAGVAVDEEGKPNGSHSSPGLVGAFVLEEHHGKTEMLACDPKIQLGAFGSPPVHWKLSLLGPSDYWGWINTTGDGNQGIFVAWHTILAPYGTKIRNLAGFPASYDNTSHCTDKACERKSSSMESKLEIDTRKTQDKVFPLRVSITGIHKGKPLPPKTWPLPFDFNKWSYVAPKDWPLKDVEF